MKLFLVGAFVALALLFGTIVLYGNSQKSLGVSETKGECVEQKLSDEKASREQRQAALKEVRKIRNKVSVDRSYRESVRRMFD